MSANKITKGDKMSITERQKLVLNAVVNYYLSNGSSVGSRTLVKRYGIEFSSATIRNVMADLEDMGYIEKTHSSSGRVPTDKGYKYYLSELLRIEELTIQEREKIEFVYEKRMTELDNILRETSSLLSRLTTYAGIVMEPTSKMNTIKKIKVIYVDENMLLVVVVLEDRRVQTKKIISNTKLDEHCIEKLSCELEILARENKIVMQDVEEYITNYSQLDLQGYSKNVLSEKGEDSKIFIENLTSVFKDKQVSEVSHAIDLFHHGENVKTLIKGIIMSKNPPPNSVQVLLGDELGVKGLEDISFVYSTYAIGNSVGIIGVIGPKRMAYSKTMGLIGYVTHEVDKIINRK